MELVGDKLIINDESLANSLHSKGSIGTLVKTRLELSMVEAYYLMNKGKIDMIPSFVKKASRFDKRFIIRYKVFENLRNNGYVVKTALKYGFDYRVYEKGSNMGDEHAKWLVNCFSENEKYSWKDYSKMMRIAHSVKKKALIAVVDDEGDVTFWESGWNKV